MLAGQVRDSKRMLKPVVAGAGEDKVGGAELLEVSEALEGRGVDDCDLEGGQVEVAVDGVVEDLALVVVVVVVERRREG